MERSTPTAGHPSGGRMLDGFLAYPASTVIANRRLDVSVSLPSVWDWKGVVFSIVVTAALSPILSQWLITPVYVQTGTYSGPDVEINVENKDSVYPGGQDTEIWKYDVERGL